MGQQLSRFDRKKRVQIVSLLPLFNVLSQSEINVTGSVACIVVSSESLRNFYTTIFQNSGINKGKYTTVIIIGHPVESY